MKRLKTLLGLAARPRPQVGVTPADVVFSENKWRLLRYRPSPEGRRYATPLLLVPSLINRHYVLDLMPGKSLVEYLVDQGHDVFIVDWGTPEDEDRYLDFDTIVSGYVGRALRKVASYSPSGKAHVLGYCLGGTLAAIHLAQHAERAASFIALATPVRFDDDGLLARWTQVPSFDVEALVRGVGLVPWQLLQASFTLLRPTMNLSKLVHFIDRADDDAFVEGFLALETWANDNVSFPGAAYARYLTALYQRNDLYHDRLTVNGAPVRLGDIACPTLAITFGQDAIVPLPAAQALLEKLGPERSRELHLPGGHVGGVVAASARKRLWPHVHAWLVENAPAATSAGLSVAEPAAGAPVAPAPATRPTLEAVPAPERVASSQAATGAGAAAPKARSRRPRAKTGGPAAPR